MVPSKEKSGIIRKSAPFTWIRGNLFKLGLDQIMRRCVSEEEFFDILLSYHDGPCGGHFAAKRTTFKLLQVGYLLSPKLASFLYTFLDSFHSPRPPKLSTSLHINHKRAFKMVFNYVLCLLFEIEFFSLSCGILSLSATVFVKVYIVGIFRQIDPHVQVGNDMDMDRVLLAHSDSSEEAVVNGGQAVVNKRVLRQ